MHDGDRDADQQVSRVRIPVPCRATNESSQELNEINLINKFDYFSIIIIFMCMLDINMRIYPVIDII